MTHGMHTLGTAGRTAGRTDCGPPKTPTGDSDRAPHRQRQASTRIHATVTTSPRPHIQHRHKPGNCETRRPASAAIREQLAGLYKDRLIHACEQLPKPETLTTPLFSANCN